MALSPRSSIGLFCSLYRRCSLFTRSGRVAVTKLKKELLSDYLKIVDSRH
jgi:hypothetical protein